MRTLFSLGSKQLKHRKGRSVLTAGGIVLGVAILFGVLVSNATTQTGVDRLIEDFTGRADVLVSPTGAFDATAPETIVVRLDRLPDVEVAVGSYRLFSSTRVPAREEPVEISVRGVDLERARKLQRYRLATGRFFADGAREVVVPERLAAKLRVRPGGTIALATPPGLRRVRVVGVITDTGAGRTDQGDVAFTSLANARRLGGVGREVSGVRLDLRAGVDTDRWIETHSPEIGPGFDVRNARTLAEGFKQFLSVLGSVFAFFAAITLFVGAFLIYLTLSMAVIERVRVYGAMRALGATRAQVRRVVVAEALALGVISTVFGLALGLLVARGLISMMASLFEIEIAGLTVRPGAVVAGIAVGLLTTLLSALVPARRAARLSPVVAMRGEYAAETKLGRGWIAGVAFVAFGVTAGLAAGAEGGAIATPLILLGSVLLVPLMLRPLARLLGRLTHRIARGVGDVAVLHLVKERSRSAYTLALIMVVMAMIFSIGGMQASVLRAFDDALDRQFGADLEIEAAGTLGPTFERDLRAIPGVGETTAIRFAFLTYFEGDEQEDAFARIIDPQTYFRIASFAFSAGNDRDARAALARGGSVLMPEIQAASLGLRRGGAIRLNTSSGARDFPIAATYSTFAAGPPELIVSLGDARRWFNAGNPTSYNVNVARGASVETVRRALERAFAGRYNVEIRTADDLKEEARTEIGRFFNIFYAILLVAAVVGLLGLANTLAMSVLQRYREIGVLRAIGTTRGQVRRMVLVESATLGAVAFALSVPVGLLLSVLVLRGMESAFGFDVPYVYPASWVPVVAAFGVIVAVLAALAPGRRAARLEVTSALQYE